MPKDIIVEVVLKSGKTCPLDCSSQNGYTCLVAWQMSSPRLIYCSVLQQLALIRDIAL